MSIGLAGAAADSEVVPEKKVEGGHPFAAVTGMMAEVFPTYSGAEIRQIDYVCNMVGISPEQFNTIGSNGVVPVSRILSKIAVIPASEKVALKTAGAELAKVLNDYYMD